MRTDTPGPAASFIDWGYAVKHPPSRMVDEWAFSIGIPVVCSLTTFLDTCYVVRRPGFVAVDIFSAAVIRFWSQQAD